MTPKSEDQMIDAELKLAMAKGEKKVKLQKRAFPKWQSFFKDKVGFELEKF